MSCNYVHPRNLLVANLQRLYDYGMTTTSGGNISIKDGDGNIWITPSGVDKGTLRPDDIMMVKPDGEIIGKHRPSVELPFHSAVYKLRPDAKTVLHAHSPALVAFSLVGKCPDTSLIPGCEAICGKVAFSKYDIPGSRTLGDIISAEFAKGADCVMMENHGAVVCGESVEQAFARFETLDYIARIQIQAAGMKAPLKPEGAGKCTAWETFAPSYASPVECELRDSIVKFASRLYRQRLVFTGNAVLSAQIGNDDLLVTPAGFDPLALRIEDVVRISGGKCEAGKTPACQAALIREIYAKNDWAHAVIMTRSPNVMAFACTGTELDSRTIPESYIQLRDIPFVSCKEFMENPSSVVAKITPATPVVIIESCGVLTVGKHLTEAFDRLEVADFTANCIRLAARIGEVKPITEQQVQDIINAFNLPA